MPTGYTACINDGVSFKDFVLRCACAGFYDTQTLPEKYTGSDYYSKKLISLNDDLKCIESMSIEEAEIKSQKEYDEQVLHENNYHNGKIKLRKKYEDMLKQVGNWEPPSPNHVWLKDFIIKQLESSIDFDCKEYAREKFIKLSGKDWLLKTKTKILKDIKYYTDENCKESKRVADNNLWLEQLRNSLKEE